MHWMPKFYVVSASGSVVEGTNDMVHAHEVAKLFGGFVQLTSPLPSKRLNIANPTQRPDWLKGGKNPTVSDLERMRELYPMITYEPPGPFTLRLPRQFFSRFLGIKIEIDDKLAPGTMLMKGPDGNELFRIVNIDGERTALDLDRDGRTADQRRRDLDRRHRIAGDWDWEL